MGNSPPLETRTERFLELLAYAVVCFKHCTNPFDITHLQKKHVTADECIDLSGAIASILEDEIDGKAVNLSLESLGKKKNIPLLGRDWIAQAEKEFQETQQ